MRHNIIIRQQRRGEQAALLLRRPLSGGQGAYAAPGFAPAFFAAARPVFSAAFRRCLFRQG